MEGNEIMKASLQSSLFEKYPKIFRQNDLPMQQTAMCWGIDTGDGWYNIIDTLCSQIQWHIKHNLDKDEDPEAVNVEATQVKEKFGGLRFYYIGGNDFISGLACMAESMSEKTCEECGSPGTQNDVGWIRTQCDSCREKQHLRMEEERLRFEKGTQAGDPEPTAINVHGDDARAIPLKND
jgi:hypothetical protein